MILTRGTRTRERQRQTERERERERERPMVKCGEKGGERQTKRGCCKC